MIGYCLGEPLKESQGQLSICDSKVHDATSRGHYGTDLVTERGIDEGHIVQSEEDLIGTSNHSNLIEATSAFEISRKDE